MIDDLLGALFEAIGELFGAAGEMAGSMAGDMAGEVAGAAAGLGNLSAPAADLALHALLLGDFANRRQLDAPLQRAGLRPVAGVGDGSSAGSPAKDLLPDPDRVPHTVRARILSAMEARLTDRLPRFGGSPQECGAAAHDRLLLTTLRRDPAAGWNQAADDLDTHALVQRIAQPHPQGSEDHKAFLFGFLRANRDAADFLRDAVAGSAGGVSRPASAAR